MGIFTGKETLELFKILIERDEDFQRLKAAEECSELSAALIRGQRNQIIEEMADVYIMLEQLRIIFKCDETLQKMIKFKLARLKERCDAGTHGERKGDRECDPEVS